MLYAPIVLKLDQFLEFTNPEDGWPGLGPGISGEGAEPLIQNFGCPVLRCFGRAGLLSVSPSRNSNDAPGPKTAIVENVLAPSCKIEVCPNKAETRPLWLSLPSGGRRVANDKKQAADQFCRKMTESPLE